MTEIHTAAMNVLFVPVLDGGEEKLQPSAEVILIGSRPEYSFDAKGNLVRGRAVVEMRFVASVPALRAIAVSLTGYADALEQKVIGKAAVGTVDAEGPPETTAPAV